MLSLFLCLLIGHLTADFILQTRRVTAQRFCKKLKSILKGNFLHASTHFFVYMVITLFFLGPLEAILASVVLAGIHVMIDIGKSLLVSRFGFSKSSIFLFLSDQILHIASILAITVQIRNSVQKSNLLSDLLQQFIKRLEFLRQDFTGEQKWLVVIFLLIGGLWVTGVFINLFFDWLNKAPDDKSENGRAILLEKTDTVRDMPSGGFIIGILERFFIIVAIVFGAPEIIGFLLATKSIARFKKFDNDNFVEKFIIGSLLSFICAIIIGVVIRVIGVMPQLLNQQ